MEKRDLSNQWGDVIGYDCFITYDESKGFGVLPQQVAWRALSAHMHHLLRVCRECGRTGAYLDDNTGSSFMLVDLSPKQGHWLELY